jgi:hypothetical protein
MRRLYAGLFLLSLATLIVEVLLTRIFDVILSPNLSFMVITCAIFGLALGGLFDMLSSDTSPHRRSLAMPALAFAVSVWALPALLNTIPFSLDRLSRAPIAQVSWFLCLYLILLIPFFCAGLTVCRIFSDQPHTIRRLYFWDLTGAAFGTALLIPLMPRLGPERLLAGTGLAGLCAAACLMTSSKRRLAIAPLAVGLLALPHALGSQYLTLTLHDNKRDARAGIERGHLEFLRWDPVSQIAVLVQPPLTNSRDDHGRKHVAYDGGTQSSDFFPFDGNFSELRRDLPNRLAFQFWRRAVLASHFLKRDTGHQVLIIGSAGGQETKAALLYGASDIDAVEMVGTMVELGTHRYNRYIGGLFTNPAVHLHVGEGRSFLRASQRTYDVIQVFSNYTSSSIAAGSGALSPAYLQTKEAFIEYFTHLNGDGILHVNHLGYPRTIATAAAAWNAIGRDRFRSHVMVFETQGPEPDYLPTVLIKMTPWTAAEVDDITHFFSFPAIHETSYQLVESPLNPVDSFLPDAFFSGVLPTAVIKAAPYDPSVVTDDRPFFHFLRRSFGRVRPDRTVGLNPSTAAVLNDQLRAGWLPMDWAHLFVAAAASVVYGGVFLVVPLCFSRVGREPWSGKGPTLIYFSLLGLGFITLELVFIQLFMKLIGYPLYAITTVITVMLLGAAVGSMSSRAVVAADGSRWYVAFVGVITIGVVIASSEPLVSTYFMSSRLPWRLAVAGGMIFPMAFFMGMPFPLGILSLQSKPRGAIAWAWSMNGLFTTVGGVASAVCSLWLGFRATTLLALAVYAVAGLAFVPLRERDMQSDKAPDTLKQVPAASMVGDVGDAALGGGSVNAR